MKFPLIAAAFGIAASSLAAPAFAAFWQDPVTQECSLKPGDVCEVIAKCPSYQPFATIPAFDAPVTDPKNAQVGLVSMMPMEANAWRLVWRNFGDEAIGMTASVTLRCGKDLKWGG